MVLAVIILIIAILAVLLVNELGLDATSARVLRIVILAGALLYAIVQFVPLR